MTATAAGVPVADTAARELEAARLRTLDVLASLPDEQLVEQHARIMSPLVWDLAHVGNYEEQWLLREVAGQPSTSSQYDDMYDAFRHPRPNRPRLPLLPPGPARDYIASVRRRVLEVLHGLGEDAFDGGGTALLRHGFVYGMVVRHEHQHAETMLATIQLRDPVLGAYEPAHRSAPASASAPAAVPPMVRVDGGPCVIGTDDDPWAYDNERAAHEVVVPSFRIDPFPVTNAAYAEFIAAGGYDDERLWHPEGWAWRQSEPAEHPLFWRRQPGGGWTRLRFGVEEDLPGDEPVQHVCFYEADAYARWAGKRLPTEHEWEKAASWDPVAGRKRVWPWGDGVPTGEHAGLVPPAGTSHGHRPSPVGSRPAGVSAYGVHQMLGDVWEWTSSDFLPWAEFRSFPYREYSEVFFGQDYKVLRGGSWATAPVAVSCTFRNWDYPIRRQIFTGFRCAADD